MYFTDSRNARRFFNQFFSGVSTEYGSDWWLHGDYADLNQAMRDVAFALRNVICSQLDEMQAAEDAREIAHAQAVLAKHGYRAIAGKVGA